jgi:hypothetical protein
MAPWGKFDDLKTRVSITAKQPLYCVHSTVSGGADNAALYRIYTAW